MWKRFAYVSAAIAAMFLLLPRAGANKNFVPDWTFQGSSSFWTSRFKMCSSHPHSAAPPAVARA